MKEIWKDIVGFHGYQVSDTGRIRSFWRKKHYPKGYGTYRELSDEPYDLSQSDDGNGYMKVCLYSSEDKKRYCKKVHKLVADAFIPLPEKDADYTVDHIRSGSDGKRDNSVSNLRWLTRTENIKKAYRDGCCDERIINSHKPVIVVDEWTGEERYFKSIGDAAKFIKVSHSSISHVLIGDYERVRHYRVMYAGREDVLLYGNDGYEFDY